MLTISNKCAILKNVKSNMKLFEKVIKQLDKNLNVWYTTNTKSSWNKNEKNYKTTWQSKVNVL